MKTFVVARGTGALAVVAVLTLTVTACGPKVGRVPTGTQQADRFLFDRGNETLKQKKWLKAREYFREIVDNYPGSQFRPDAKLGLGDTYLGENTTESLVLAANEFREFLTFFPTNPRADYAQYRLALTHFGEMLGPDRDQTQTKEAVQELQLFVERFPNSTLMGEVRKKLRQAKDRLSDHEYKVGFFYYRIRWYPGAIDRFRSVLKDDPEYTSRDAVYFYLAESLVLTDRKAEALPYFERLVKEFQTSQFLVKATTRIEELKKG